MDLPQTTPQTTADAAEANVYDQIVNEAERLEEARAKRALELWQEMLKHWDD
jgi:hypothetical protein